MNTNILDVIVIGGGHAGLSISYCLKQLQLSHLVFERNRIGETWRTQRWDSFKLNTPNKVNLLPGIENIFPDGGGFASASEFASLLEYYVRKFNLPVRENSEVLSVEKVPDSDRFFVCVSENGSAGYYLCKEIVIASGAQNRKIVPLFAGKIPPGIFQLHASEYRNPDLLPEGSVLVVGSAQSGVQIAEDLVNAGRKVFLSTSKVGRFPRRYRGKDIIDWLILNGFFDQRTAYITDPEVFKMKQPQISGTGMQGHTLSLQSLAGKGVVILGKASDASDSTIFLQPDAASKVRFADAISRQIKDSINEYIKNNLLDAPSPEADSEDRPDPSASTASTITELKLSKNNITSVIWATGFTGNYPYLKIPATKEFGVATVNNGASFTKGLYFIGTPWLRKRKSGIILGIREDAEYVASKILTHAGVAV